MASVNVPSPLLTEVTPIYCCEKARDLTEFRNCHSSPVYLIRTDFSRAVAGIPGDFSLLEKQRKIEQFRCGGWHCLLFAALSRRGIQIYSFECMCLTVMSLGAIVNE
jgi:hypothetical protein